MFSRNVFKWLLTALTLLINVGCKNRSNSDGTNLSDSKVSPIAEVVEAYNVSLTIGKQWIAPPEANRYNFTNVRILCDIVTRRRVELDKAVTFPPTTYNMTNTPREDSRDGRSHYTFDLYERGKTTADYIHCITNKKWKPQQVLCLMKADVEARKEKYTEMKLGDINCNNQE